jgi:hypothetical protein
MLSLHSSLKKLLITGLILCSSTLGFSQENPDLGAWYMYFGNLRFTDSPWAIHGEVQYRNHNLMGDLEQLLLRTGLQYNLKSGQASFLAGYGSITSGDVGESTSTSHENRTYQEVILRQKLGKVGIQHRYRYEQRWIENTDFRTRFRYFISVSVPLNQKDLAEKGALYVQIYDEIFINGEQLTESMQYFDRNRLYLALGYRTSKNLALQLGVMEQTTSSSSKTQLQFSAFHQIFTR